MTGNFISNADSTLLTTSFNPSAVLQEIFYSPYEMPYPRMITCVVIDFCKQLKDKDCTELS